MSAISLLCLVLGLGFLLRRHHTRAKRAPLPPGPNPISTAIHLLFSKRDVIDPWVSLHELGDKFGPVSRVSFFGSSIIVLNSRNVTKDLLDRRGAKYSDRGGNISIEELMGWNQSMVFISHKTSTWRLGRKLLAKYLNKNALVEYHGMIEQEMAKFATRLPTNPKDFVREAKRTLSKILWKLTYGLDIDSEDSKDPYPLLADHVIATLVASASTDASVVDFLPILRYAPSWLPFQKRLKAKREDAQNMMNIPFERVKQNLAIGVSAPSFASHVLEENETKQDDHEHSTLDIMDEQALKWLCGTIFLGGRDNIIGTIHCFILAMVLYPDVQRKAQEEVDRVTVEGRMPSFQDKEKLPYVDGLIKELYRWHLIIPLGSRRLTEDDEYEGYFLPKGSMVISNYWGTSQDESIYPDPSAFNPDRFIDPSSGGEHQAPLDPQSYAFGSGRRICPGIQLSNALVYGAVTSLLHSTTFSKTVDEDGKEIEPRVAFTSGLASAPEPFEYTATARTQRTQ